MRKKENAEETLQPFAASTELECERQEYLTQLSVKKNLSSLSCQLAAEEAYTTVSCNKSVVLSNRLSRWASKSENKKHVSMPAGPEAKESPGFFDLMAFFRSPYIFALWFSADSRTQKLNSDKFDQ